MSPLKNSWERTRNYFLREPEQSDRSKVTGRKLVAAGVLTFAITVALRLLLGRTQLYFVLFPITLSAILLTAGVAELLPPDRRWYAALLRVVHVAAWVFLATLIVWRIFTLA